MEEVVRGVGVWGCGLLAALAVIWGAVVLVVGRAPRRALSQYRSVTQYGLHSIGLGLALGLLAIGAGLGGWYVLSTLAGFGILVWLIRQRRARQEV